MRNLVRHSLPLLCGIILAFYGPSSAWAEGTEADGSLLDYRLAKEKEALTNEYVITAYKPNYILYTYNGYPNPSANALYDGPAQERELKFQVSLKYCLLAGETYRWHLAYTQQAYWQAFRVSAPFRETNHEPETMFTWLVDSGEFAGIKLPMVTIALDHQSNGRGGADSRSWNRAYADILLESGAFSVSIKPWYRFVEGAANDDNPDITRYLGYGELRFLYGRRDNEFSLMIRNNLRREAKGAYEATWSRPIHKKKSLRFYVQFFTGYGEDLIDYNHSNRRIGAGFMLNDWL